MPNPFEAIWNSLKTITDTDLSPLHVGEVMISWTYLTMIKEMMRFEEIGLNTTIDQEVKEVLIAAYKMCKSQAERLEAFLIKEGIPLAETTSPKPQTSPSDVPAGVRITDDELMNGVSIKVAAAIMECATGQAQSIRHDMGMIWVEFHSELLTFGTSLKTIMKNRGWLKVPPYYPTSVGAR